MDFGLKDLAIASNIDKPFKNINKSKEVKRLKKKLKRKQRQVSRKYEKSKIQIGKEGENRYKFAKTNNIKKLEKEIKLIQRRLSNIRLNHIHQVTTEIVETKPSRIIIEDLKLKDRVFICPSCNHKIDRDKNASINLSRYKKSA